MNQIVNSACSHEQGHIAYESIDGPSPNAGSAVEPSCGWQTSDNPQCTNEISAEAAQWFAAVVGNENVLWDEESRVEYSKTTLPTSTKPAMIVRPKDVSEVQQIVRGANRFGLKPHAISRGKNWGYGDACAPRDGQLIVDLRRMNRIVEINEELAYAVIEPGVTQGQLADELLARRSRLMLDVTGAGPDASIVGNTLQRGFGHTPYGDHFAHSCNYEVVLPDGNLANTGFGAIDRSRVGHVYAYGLGPLMQGNFTQSYAGVVTRMTVWLMPRPERIVGFGFKVQDESAISEVIDTLRDLRQSDVVRSIVHVANDLRVISTQLPNCWQGTPTNSLSKKQRTLFAKECGIGAWNAVGGLYGSCGAVREAMNETRRAFRGLATVHFFSRKKVDFLQKVSRLTRGFTIGKRAGRILNSVRDVLDLLEGVPTTSHLNGARWRNNQKSVDLRDTGLIWVAPVIPLQRSDVENAIRIITETFQEFDFDPMVTISPISPRAAICIANVSFDKEDSGEVLNAAACGQAVKARLFEFGYPTYRTSSIQSH